MKEKRLVAMALAVVFCVVLTFPGPVRADVVWSDDFNDGNYDEWIICENPVYSSGSNWSAASYYLQLDQEDQGIISYNSSVAYGTWSFDFKADDAQVEFGTFAEIVFICSNLDGGTFDDIWGYWIHIQAVSAGEGYSFALSLRKAYLGEYPVIVSAEDLVPIAGWHHIDVTRTTAGLFSVYHNGSLVMQGEDNEIVTSELFSLWFEQGQICDNIVVDNEITVTESPPIWIYIMIVASAVVIVAVVGIILKRR